MQELQIPNGYFQLLNMYLLQQGMDIFTLPFLEQHQTQLRYVLSLPIDSQSTYSFFLGGVELTRQHAHCPQLVLEMARLIRPEHFGVLGYMVSRSNSVAEALHNIIRFSRLVIDGEAVIPMQLLHQTKEIHLSWPLQDTRYMMINELTSACMAHLAKQIFPASLQLLSMQFAHAPQMARYHYEKFFGCEVSFGHVQYSFVISSDNLDSKSELADPSLMQLLLRQAEEAIASKSHYGSLDQHIYMRVAEYLRQKNSVPKIEQIANELHVSARTLQRQLNDLDSSFKKIVEAERMKRCEQLLQQDMSLTDIAMQLGYSDQSALARAYKAYSGQTLLQKKQQFKIPPKP
mgnify:CR=1 FL=1